MGTEAGWIPLVLAAVGTGVQVYNTQQAEKRQNRALTQQLLDQQAIDKKAQKIVSDEVLKRGQSDPEQYRKDSLDQYMDQIQKTSGKASGGLNQVGGVSDAFRSNAAGAAADIQAESALTADSLSRIDAPGRQRMDEGISFNRASSDLGRVGAMSDSARYLGDIQMRRASARDPWLDALGSGLSSYGQGGGSFGLGGG
jgi:hypothetical protein